MAMSAKLNLLQPLTCNSDVSIWVKEDDKQQTNADLSLSFNLSFAREINSENPEVKSRETQPYIWVIVHNISRYIPHDLNMWYRITYIGVSLLILGDSFDYGVKSFTMTTVQ